MKRSPLKRKTRIQRHTPIAPVNSKRKAKERLRQFGELAEWVATLDCYNCGRAEGVVPAHVTGRRRGGAWGEDGRGNLLPLCDDPFRPGCHDLQHARGWSALKRIGNLARAKEIAAEYGAQFRGLQDG